MPGSPRRPSAPEQDAIEEILASVLAAQPEERPGRLERACREHASLAGDVGRQLGTLLRLGLLPRDEPGDAAAPNAVTRPTPALPERLGPFELGRRLGGGGMGVVHEATDPGTGRRVAVKLLRPELLPFAETRARFQREVAVLADLDHPGLVPVLQYGEDRGVPWYAMPLVAGRSLAAVLHDLADQDPRRLLPTDFARPAARDAVHAACALVRDIALVLQHAHDHGVIHRDVKPSNVMITEDGRALLIDFGLAHAVHLDSLTRTGVQPGSLAYMAPEQLRGEPVDARSDVFSLGCVLYELLSLRSPFAAETEQQIRQKVLAAAPEPLRSVHPGLPWEATVVCSTAMAPEAGRRYASAAALADDLHALLHSRPIAARRAGPLLRTARWSRRHPALASALTVLGLGLVSTTWFALEARAEAERSGQQEALAKATAEANARLAREQTALAAAEARAKDEARRHAAAAAARADDLEQILKFQGKRWLADDVPRMGLALRRALLQRSPASRGAGLETALTGTDFASVVIDLLQEQVLEPSRAAIEREVEQPTVKARLLQGIADALRLYGRPSAAEAPQQQAYKLAMEHFAESDPARASALTGMALQLQDTGRLGEAEPLLRKALSLREQHLGADDDETISSMALLAKLLGLRGQFAEHESLGQEVLDRCLRVHGDDHEQTIRARQNIGVRLHNSGRSLEAEPMLREAAAAAQRTLGAEHPLTLFCMHSHATCLESLGNTREAEPLHQQTLAARRRILGDDHPQTLSSLDTLAVLLARRGDAAAAESMLRETLDRRRRLLGDSHQDLVVPANNLGAFLRSKNRHEEALEPLRLAQSAAVDSLGHEHPHTLRATRDLVEALTKCRKDEEVVRVVEATLAARPRALDELDVETAAMVGRLALLRMERTDFPGALPMLRSLVTFLGKTQGNQDPATLQYVTMLGSALLQTGQAHEARQLMAPFESAARQAFGAGPRRLLLARFLELLGRALGSEATEAAHQQAEARLLEAHRILVGQPAAPPDMRRRVVMGLLELYQAWQRVDPTPGREAQIAEWHAALADLETRK